MARWLLPLVAALSSCSPAPQGRTVRAGAIFSALIFSKTAGFRHDSIPNGIEAISELAAENGFNADASEDSKLFTDEGLANYQLVIFLSTSGTILDDRQKAAFQRFIEGGNGFVGIHSATDTEYDWAWYGQLVGAYFRSHPQIQPAAIQVEDPNHPSTAKLPSIWKRTDEWYNFQTNPRGASTCWPPWTRAATRAARCAMTTPSPGAMMLLGAAGRGTRLSATRRRATVSHSFDNTCWGES